MNYFRNIVSILGVDKAILFTSSARIVQGLGGMVSVLFVLRYLSPIEQGFYYTFASVVAIQVFFELGLNGIITQYVAHEASHLTLIDNQYEGERKYLSRMASLFRFCIRWFAVLSGALFIILCVTGIVFFNHFYRAEAVVSWIIPWILLSFGTAVSFLVSPFISFIQGLGFVKEIAKIRLFQQAITLLTMWSGLIFGLKLFVGGIGSILSVVALSFFVLRKFFPILTYIYSIKITDRVSYRREIFPFQWKIALSWISGYFIFQIFNPVLFATEGAQIAGQMGVTLTALNAVMGFTMSWVSTKIPTYSGMIAQKKYLQLDALFNKTLLQSSSINAIALMGIFFTIYGLRYYNVNFGGVHVGNRFLHYLPMAFMMFSTILNHIIGAWATYLRCHKREPMLVQSITIGILCTISVLFMGKMYGVVGMTFGYMNIVIISFFWTYSIFKKSKEQWHNE